MAETTDNENESIGGIGPKVAIFRSLRSRSHSLHGTAQTPDEQDDKRDPDGVCAKSAAAAVARVDSRHTHSLTDGRGRGLRRGRDEGGGGGGGGGEEHRFKSTEAILLECGEMVGRRSGEW